MGQNSARIRQYEDWHGFLTHESGPRLVERLQSILEGRFTVVTFRHGDNPELPSGLSVMDDRLTADGTMYGGAAPIQFTPSPTDPTWMLLSIYTDTNVYQAWTQARDADGDGTCTDAKTPRIHVRGLHEARLTLACGDNTRWVTWIFRRIHKG